MCNRGSGGLAVAKYNANHKEGKNRRTRDIIKATTKKKWMKNGINPAE